jgi:hypothetical protein
MAVQEPPRWRSPPSYEGGWLVILSVAEVIDLKDLFAECTSEVLA